MDVQKFIKSLLSNTYTKADAVRRMRVLRMILENEFFAHDQNQEQKLESFQIAKEDINAVKEWLTSGSLEFNSSNLYKSLKNISEDIDLLPNIIFYIASTITDPAYLAKITTWVRTYVSKDALLQLKVDPKKVGGLAFVQKGLLQDYSLEYFMKQKRKDILDMIGTYGNN